MNDSHAVLLPISMHRPLMYSQGFGLAKFPWFLIQRNIFAIRFLAGISLMSLFSSGLKAILLLVYYVQVFRELYFNLFSPLYWKLTDCVRKKAPEIMMFTGYVTGCRGPIRGIKEIFRGLLLCYIN